MLRKPPPPKRDRTGEFDSYKPRRCVPPSALIVGVDIDAVHHRHAVPPKIAKHDRKRQSLRDSANVEDCTLRIFAVCNHDNATTVLAHWPGLDGGRGMGMKSIDLASAYACSSCHDVLDGRRPRPPGISYDSIMLDFLSGHMRTLVRFVQKGLV